MVVDVVLDAHASKQFEKAPPAVRAKLRALARKLADDPQSGEYVPVADVHRKATLKAWEARVGAVRNLYKLELPDGWRALYTVGSRGVQRVAMVLEVADHKRYERLMGY